MDDEPAIKGDATGYVPGGGGELASSRFVVVPTGAQTFTGTQSGVVHWPVLDGGDPRQWDDLGFPSDYFTTWDFFPPESGTYLITAYVQFVPDTSWSVGTIVISFDTPEQPQEGQSGDCLPARGALDLSVSSVHKLFNNLGDSVKLKVSTVDVDDDVIVAKASITFTKLS